jgi:hypothetical protein
LKKSSLLALVVLLLGPQGAASADFRDLAPLAQGSVPECPKNAGTREYRTATIQLGDEQAFIAATSRSDGHKCDSSAVLHLKRGDKESVIPFSAQAGQMLSVVDFSTDQSHLLLALDLQQPYPNEQSRYLMIAVVPTGGGTAEWRNAWDVLGWKDCDATIDAQGFSDEGKAVLLVRPSVLSPLRHPGCVDAPTLYAIDSQDKVATIPIATKVQRDAKAVRAQWQTCATDPDLAGACFTVHGRLSYWNGAPATRISVMGTKRILGVPDEIVPESMAPQLTDSVEAFGDYRVCPMTRERTGHMQMVCIDSAENVTYKSRR